jgi:hypothetical protein
MHENLPECFMTRTDTGHALLVQITFTPQLHGLLNDE